MSDIIPLEEVLRVRQAVEAAHTSAAEHFRSTFEQSTLPPNERWGAYMHIRADALLAAAQHIRLRQGRLLYEFDGRAVTPYILEGQPPDVALGQPVYPFFDVPRRGEAVFEYFVIISEIFSTPTWNLTKVIASADDFNHFLGTMTSPQIVDVTFASFLPAFDFGADGTSFLHVTLITRAGEERIERRTLSLDANNEFHFHSRKLIAEGSAGVRV